MATASSPARREPADKVRSEFAQDIVAGLTGSPKRISPKYLYDDVGCDLFTRITEQPEYYPTRVELGILAEHASDIVELMPDGAALVEFGMGTGEKVRIVLKAAAAL